MALKRDTSDYERAHLLEYCGDRRYYCVACQCYWRQRPRTFCAGVPVYVYGARPANLYTYIQRRRDLKRRPLDREQPDGAYFLRKSPYRCWLYSLERSEPRRVPTELQWQAIQRMRQGLMLKYICQHCGYYDPSYGKLREVRRFERGWCSHCWDHYHHLKRQADQCRWARRYIQQGEYLVLVVNHRKNGLGYGRRIKDERRDKANGTPA